MTGRNERCPCGSGLKYKKCCRLKKSAGQAPPNIRRTASGPRTPPAEILAQFARIQAEQADQKRRFGEVRPLVTTTFDDHRFVAVGNTLHWSKKWKTFPDFLLHYLPTVLGAEWGQGELRKPEGQRHPIIEWYNAWQAMKLRERERSKPDARGIYTTSLDGPSRAYLLLAYDLYVLRNHGALQEIVIRRLKNRDQFQGARYELFVAATMVRAGFDIAFEDEGDPTTKHPEFVATHRITGQRVSVEAKSRHRPGVLGRSGDEAGTAGFRLGIRGLLADALGKPAAHPYIIFIDANMPPEVASPLSPVNWRAEVHKAIGHTDTGRTKSGLYVGSSFNLLLVTNTPDHYGEGDSGIPDSTFYSLRTSMSVHPMATTSVLDDIEQALEKHGNVPQLFPEDPNAQ